MLMRLQKNWLILDDDTLWVESKTVLDFNSEKAQRLHKSVLEMIVLDLMPWSTVNKPGFLRNQKLSTPNFELASEKYYCDMLGPNYFKIKSALKNKLEVVNPIVIYLALIAWSAHHHGYLGIIIHYISDWHRKSSVFHSMNATLHKTFIKK